MNIVFAGTPEFAASSLKALQRANHNIVAVYTQPDRPAGRGRKLQVGPVKQLALDSGLDIYQPISLKAQNEADQLAALKPDVMIVVAYGLILPAAILKIPKLGCLNVHASLLPRWRGAAPIQRAIEAGDQTTGVTIMQMEAGLDTGPMLLKVDTEIQPDDNASTLHDRLAELGAEALIRSLEKLEKGGLTATKQDDSAASYATKLTKTEADIDWSEAAAVIERKARAFNPWPMLSTQWRGKRLRILQVSTADTDGEDNARKTPGSVCDISETGFTVATGDGELLVKRVQLEGKKPQSAAEFLNGHALKVGDCLT